MIWIGSKTFSCKIFHFTRWKLDQSNSYYDILGVKFSINLEDMIDLNHNLKIVDVNKLLQQLKYRRLTPVGGLTIIKSLIITKVNHF